MWERLAALGRIPDCGPHAIRVGIPADMFPICECFLPDGLLGLGHDSKNNGMVS